ncbi:hypothetical protein TTHERM_000818428 (macronuclear) [Tetrahymena thermophila SB210]|uniref:Uncharacterized protein n=1 Tax=Tetrahymena thermophila (strain SB210) TaxID=312017 RepID=W7XAI9_TETTS|nr:hypothetical protein TTHERM_000818428 [Tetrahymena thermophila SB210]EWS74352.1 hypothetical protein TTHERM_000818428 [Tetrahymena thermophila SB210]|eukprot:XP_012653112.1 hypothetical protein TTHERM_000818428 [Tetrahymena thermophila SB210]
MYQYIYLKININKLIQLIKITFMQKINTLDVIIVSYQQIQQNAIQKFRRLQTTILVNGIQLHTFVFNQLIVQLSQAKQKQENSKKQLNLIEQKYIIYNETTTPLGMHKTFQIGSGAGYLNFYTFQFFGNKVKINENLWYLQLDKKY